MIVHVPFEALTEKHLTWIAESVLAPPPESRLEAEDLLRSIKNGTMCLFEWEDGCVLLGARNGRLLIFAFACHNLLKRMPQLVEDIKRVATEWQCDNIETTCFHRGITSAIKKLGAVTESETLVLAVE